MSPTRLFEIPVELREANEFVARFHRHHKPVVGHRFSLGVVDDSGVLRGVAIVGRPVARLSGHPRDVAEITRLCTDGSRNACSKLYAAAARAAAAIGYRKIQTYTLSSEVGTSLLASGWTKVARVEGRQWKHSDGKPRRSDQPTDDKDRWERVLNSRPDLLDRRSDVRTRT